MLLEIDLKNIKLLSQQKKNENNSFQSFLKKQDSEKIDTIVHKLNDEITPQIECVECGNCCKNVRPTTSNEVLRLFVEEKNLDDYRYLPGFTCKHLNDKKCNIYLDRYEECKSYPYLDRNDFVSRLTGVLQNYEICPIVYNVFEQLKLELDWKD